MTRWRHLEEYARTAMLLGSSFSAHEYAAATDITVEQASRNIQAYLGAQRSERSKTAYILRRTPGTRTRNARWAVGRRTADARAVGKVFGDDVKAKALRAFEPDLNRIAELNPRTAALVERQLRATMENAIALLSMAVQGMSVDGDGE